jgi:holo-[acyl-carrier protein] synthase
MQEPSLDSMMQAVQGRLGPEVRLGIDLVEVSEVVRACQHFGDRYLRRIYTPAELAYCRAAAADPTPHLAARFAAKEAAVKVLRPGAEDEGLDWRSLETVRTEDGWCRLVLHGAAARLAARQHLVHFEVSLTHAEKYAAAIVLAAPQGASLS